MQKYIGQGARYELHPVTFGSDGDHTVALPCSRKAADGYAVVRVSYIHDPNGTRLAVAFVFQTGNGWQAWPADHYGAYARRAGQAYAMRSYRTRKAALDAVALHCR
jgi:hypothetical protein